MPEHEGQGEILREFKPLELVSTDDLLSELKNRFDAYIFHAIRKKYDDNKSDRYQSSWDGGGVLCIGLWETLKKTLMEEYSKYEEEC